jgi:hypothetical protein
MKINCQEHRKAMGLLVIRKKLKDGISDSKKMKEVKERIRTLEKALGLD